MKKMSTHKISNLIEEKLRKVRVPEQRLEKLANNRLLKVFFRRGDNDVGTPKHHWAETIYARLPGIRLIFSKMGEIYYCDGFYHPNLRKAV